MKTRLRKYLVLFRLPETSSGSSVHIQTVYDRLWYLLQPLFAKASRTWWPALIWLLGLMPLQANQLQPLPSGYFMYQEGPVQVHCEGQLNIFGGHWIGYADISGDGQLVINRSAHALLDGHGHSIQNLTLQHSNASLLSSLSISGMLLLTESAQLQLHDHHLYLLPLASLTVDDNSHLLARGRGQVIRLSRLTPDQEAPLAQRLEVMPMEPAAVPPTPAPQPHTIDCFWPPANGIVSLVVLPAVPPPRG